MQYTSFTLEYDEDPTEKLNKFGRGGWRLVAVVPATDRDVDHRGDWHNVRLLRYVMEQGR